MAEKKLLFSVTRADCDWSTFRSSGPGGQHRNKVETAVRCLHRDSGAVGEAADDRSQLTNRREAFRRMAETEKFKFWLKIQTARAMGQPSIEETVDVAMDEKNMRYEVRDGSGRWVQVKKVEDTAHA